MKSGLEKKILGTIAAIPLALAINGSVAWADIRSKDIIYHTGKGNCLERQEPSEKKPTASYNNERIEIGDIGEPVIEYPLPVKELHPPHSNYREGRVSEIKTIVIHSSEDSAGSALNTFMNPKNEKSPHYLIDKKGEVTEFVKPENTAYHVGKKANPYTIGIELEGKAEKGDFTEQQYDKLALLINYLSRKTGVNTVVSHKWVSKNIGGTSHSDPGPLFDWKGLKERTDFYKGYSIEPVYANVKLTRR